MGQKRTLTMVMLDSASGRMHGFVPGGIMKHYRVNKLAKPRGEIVKAKDILANDDKQAIQTAREDADCPICDVLHNGQKVGSVL